MTDTEQEWLAERFAENRTHQRAAAYRMLGSVSEADDALLAAARHGDFDALVAVLDPEVVLRIDRGVRPRDASLVLRGALAVAERGVAFARLAAFARPTLVNGAAGFVVTRQGRTLGVAGFTVAHGKIVEINLLMDPARPRDGDASAPPSR